jgi:hypothetical protein
MVARLAARVRALWNRTLRLQVPAAASRQAGSAEAQDAPRADGARLHPTADPTPGGATVNAKKRFDRIRKHKVQAGTEEHPVHDMLDALCHDVLASDSVAKNAMLMGKLTAWVGLLLEGTPKGTIINLIERTLEEQ